MTKSYIDGIIDAIEIVSKWKGIGIHPSIIDSILRDLNNLLSTAQEPDSQHQISLFDITTDDEKSLEFEDLIKKIDDQLESNG